MATPDDKKKPLSEPAQPREHPDVSDRIAPALTKQFDPERLIIPPGKTAVSTPTPPPKLDLPLLQKPVAAPPPPTPAAKPRLVILPQSAPAKPTKQPPVLHLPVHPHAAASTQSPTARPLHLIPPEKLRQRREPAAATPVATVPPGTPPTPPHRRRRRSWLLLPLAAAAMLAVWMVREWHREPPPSPASMNPVPAALTPTATHAQGMLQIAALANSAEGRPIALTNAIAYTLRSAKPALTFTTNAISPILWQNLPAGDFALSAALPGYRAAAAQRITIVPQRAAAATLSFEPLPGHVRFVCSDTNTTFAVYQDGHPIGTTAEIHDLPPFVTHRLTFKAPGWRDAAVTLRLNRPGLAYRCRVATERIAAGMVVTVSSESGEVPVTGLLRVNNSTPVRVTLPLTRSALSYAGEVTLTLTLDDFTVLNNSQRVLLADRHMTNIIFRICPNK